MSRHRDIRNLDYDEEYDEAYDDSIYGHSYDENEYGTSPTTVSQYLYNNSKDKSFQIGAFFPSTDKIDEENSEEQEDHTHDYQRRDSSNFERPRLSSEDDVRLNSVLDQIRNVVGDHFSDEHLIATILAHKFDYEASLNAVLCNQTSSAPTPSAASRLSQPGPSRGAEKRSWSSSSGGATALRPVGTVPSQLKSVENGVSNLNTTDEVLPAEEIKEKEPVSAPPRAAVKIRDKEVDVDLLYTRSRGDTKALLNLVVVGHVDAGKSTLMGHLLYLQGDVAQRTMHKYEQESQKMGKQSFMYAWVLDDTEEERSRGVTVDVAQRTFQTATKTIGLLDAPGHRDFIPNMITGASRADVALLVVDASTGGFEAGFESGGQTREHAILVKSLGVSQLAVAVNKLDTVDWSSDRFNEIRSNLRMFLKTVGFREADVVFVPCSGLTGENLIKPSKSKQLNQWYEGHTLLQVIDNLKVPERAVSRPVRLCIGDVYKGQGSSMNVGGKLETGFVQNGDRLLLIPQNEVFTVKNVQVDSAEGGLAFAGDHVTLNVAGVDANSVHLGDFLCDPSHPIPLVTRVEARIVVFNIKTPIIRGSQFYFHYQSVTEMSKISKLSSLLQKNSGQVAKLKPRALLKNSSAVVELTFARPLPLECFKDFKELGRFMLRSDGTTVAAGIVTQILKKLF